ncbi:adenylate/guanylate cyclase domain-containing protein [Mesorhizobium sp. M0016]
MSQSQVPAPPPGWLPDAWLRNARLVSGLVLMAFVTLHFLNHALLLISLEAADKGRAMFLLIWRNPAGTLLLYGAVATHLVLSLLALYHRRTLAMPVREWAQILLGLSIPLLIAEHVVGTRAMHALYEANDTYEFVVRSLWTLTPQVGVRQAIAVVVIWAHGCLGLYFWLRYRRWYPRVASALLVLAVLVPVLALLGFASAGKEVSAMGPPQSQPIERTLFDRALATKERMDSSIYAGFAGLIVLVLAARIVRHRIERRNLIEVRYAGGRKVRIPRGYSVLDASRLGGIAHYAVCGGRGRCSTCRIRVVDGLAEQPEPSPIEAATLRRIAADGDVRLACQLRPRGDLRVAPLLSPPVTAGGPLGATASDPGHEKVVVVMFCDMRGFTAMADQRLPFDVVFLLNRYFGVIGRAVESSGGRVDKFVGDGAMALFGLETTPGEACRNALSAASAIVEGVRALSDDFAEELRATIKVAIGIHVGQAIVGSMGYGAVTNVTAIGDTINVGSRLEAAAKEFQAEIVVSEATVRLSGMDLPGAEAREIDIRGRARPLGVLVVPRGAAVPIALPAKLR